MLYLKSESWFYIYWVFTILKQLENVNCRSQQKIS